MWVLILKKLNNNLMGTHMHEVAKKGPVNLLPKVSLTSKALRRLKKINESRSQKKQTRFLFQTNFRNPIVSNMYYRRSRYSDGPLENMKKSVLFAINIRVVKSHKTIGSLCQSSPLSRLKLLKRTCY